MFEELYSELDDIINRVKEIMANEVDRILENNKYVSPDKTTFIDVSSNLFNKNNTTSGHAIDPRDGELVPDPDRSVSDFIKIDQLTAYSFRKSVGWTGRVAYYDVTKQLINSFPLAESVETRTSTSPENSMYVRVECVSSDLDNFQINKGEESLPYEVYFNRLSRDIEIPLDDRDIEIKYQDNDLPYLVRYITEGKVVSETLLEFDDYD